MAWLFPPLSYEGACRIQLFDRNEHAVYEDETQHATVTVGHGPSIVTESFTWESGRPRAAEQARAFANMLVFLAGRRRKKVTVYVNFDDPRRPIWDDVCAKKSELIGKIELTSDEENLALLKRTYLDGIARGGTVQFGPTATPTTAPEEVEREFARQLEEKKRERERQRLEFEC